jgi:hypothetical protein
MICGTEVRRLIQDKAIIICVNGREASIGLTSGKYVLKEQVDWYGISQAWKNSADAIEEKSYASCHRIDHWLRRIRWLMGMGALTKTLDSLAIRDCFSSYS